MTLVAGGTLGVAASVPLSTTISLTGSAAVLAFAAGAPAGAGAIAGLTLGDDLLITTTDPVAGARYIAGADDTGTLVLSDEAGKLVGSLTLLGDYAGDNFLVTPLSADGTAEQINCRPWQRDHPHGWRPVSMDRRQWRRLESCRQLARSDH